MLEGINAVYKRIEDIQKGFDKLGGKKNAEAPKGKTFNEMLMERLQEEGGDIAEATAPENQTFVPRAGEVRTENDTISLGKVGAYEVYARRYEGDNAQAAKPVNPLPGETDRFNEIINAAAKRYNLPEGLVRAVIKQESNFDPNAVSPKNATGLMQIIPSTGKELGLSEDALFNPVLNVMGGSRYLSDMLSRYDGNVELALAAYNAGPGAVDRAGGIPNYPETQNYVKRVLDYYDRYEGRK